MVDQDPRLASLERLLDQVVVVCCNDKLERLHGRQELVQLPGRGRDSERLAEAALKRQRIPFEREERGHLRQVVAEAALFCLIGKLDDFEKLL